MSIIQLYQQFGIQVAREGHKKYRQGWVNIECPFCSDGTGKFHLGFNLQSNYFYCCQCGSHKIKAALSRLLKLRDAQIEEILTTYRLRQRSRAVDAVVASKVIKIGKKRFKHPAEAGRLRSAHMKYLSNRGFGPLYLQ